ncbi:unnamed protein product, partial [Polarella glacialis]
IAFSAIRLLRAPRRWGLTATPKLERAADVSCMAEVLQVFVPPDSVEDAQLFLDHFARSNAWDVATIPLEQHTVRVSLTGRERALYMSEVQRHGEKSERCVQLCSHFAAGELCADSKMAVDRARQKQQEEKLQVEARIAEAQAALDATPASAKEQRRALGISVGLLQRSRKTIETAIQFFESTLKSLDPAETSKECSICLDDAVGDSLALTPCGHLFHEACVRSCIEANGLCPECRKEIGGSRDLIQVSGLGQSQGEGAAEGRAGNIQSYGSKLFALLSRAKDLCAADAQCKIIVFVQWEGLLKKVHSALSECGLPCLRLYGNVDSRQKTLRKFKDSLASEHRLLLLSLEKSPSGMTLTCANHVFFVHPMVAETPSLAEGYERQALGRVRRPGQEKTVHVWRFVTADTVEDELSRRP